ncbi:MAG: DUF11 domain-containing protein [Anaerolineaceae bacterium]|nr:DUF11 domain-containing protein [Anaerolineaceae bacterium]
MLLQMVRPIKLGLFLSFLLAFTLFFPQTTQAATITVAGACTLVDAITAANTDAPAGGCPAGTAGVDVISLTANVTLTAVNNVNHGPNGLPEITTPIIILGNGRTITRAGAAPQFRLFHVSGGFFGNGDLTLDDLTLSNGDIDIGTDCFLATDQCGGAILNYGGFLTVRNDSRFVNNTAFGGGALYNFGEVSIIDTTFTGNTASYGATIYNTGGQIGNPATVDILTSLFTGNTAVISGGTIHNEAELFVDDSSFTGNQVTDIPPFGSGGGAIYNTTFNGQVEITNSTFTDNQAYHGGAISNYNASDIFIFNSDISNNRSFNAFGAGGGIWSDNNANLEIHDSRITNNQALGTFGDGGGIYAGSGLNSALILVNSVVSNNTATHDGGGIYMSSGNGAVVSNIINSRIENNTAPGDGGGIYKNGISPLNISGSIIAGNSVSTPNGNGGGIFFDNPTANPHAHTITTTTISDNQAGEGAGLYSVAFTGTITITDSTIANNTTITNGAVGEGGAGVDNQHGNIDITNTTISGNRVQTNAGALSGSGAAIHHGNGGVVTINYSTLANNTSRDGGGIRAQSQVTVSNSILMNTATNGPNCNPVFVITDGGNNFVDDGTNCPAGFIVSAALNLGALADNGGPTQTHALLPGSVAIDATGNCGLNDQRGVTRDATCDSGAYENDVIPPLVSFDSAASTIEEDPGGAISVNVTLDNTAGNIANGTAEVNIMLTGTASTSGNDYTLVSAVPVVFTGGTWPAPGGTSTLTVDFNVIPDTFIEGDETIILTLNDANITGPVELGAITQHTLTIIDAISELEVTKTVALTVDVAGNGLYDPGDTVTYTITVTNLGPKNAADVALEDVLDTARLDIGAAVITPSIGVYNAVSNEWSQDGAGVGNGFALANGVSQTLTVETTILPGTIGQTIPNVVQISPAFPPAAADPLLPNNRAVANFVVGSPPNATPIPGESGLGIFDPAISKIGFLTPGQVGVTGEQLEWVITVRNPGTIAGQNVVITDTLRDELRVDRVTTTSGTSNINGQTVTVTIPTLAPGETVLISIFTTVLQGVEVENTACVDADNQGDPRCVTAFAVGALPSTGETPLWALLAQVALLVGLAGFVIGGALRVRGARQR